MGNICFKAPCRQWQSGVSTESLVLDDSLIPLHPPSPWTLSSSSPSSLPICNPCLHSYTFKENTLEFNSRHSSASQLLEQVPSGFQHSSANSIQIPRGSFFPLLRAPWGLLPPWNNSLRPLLIKLDQKFIPDSVEDYACCKLVPTYKGSKRHMYDNVGNQRVAQ